MTGTSVSDLARWVESLDGEACRNLLLYLCGWKPDVIRTLYREERQK